MIVRAKFNVQSVTSYPKQWHVILQAVTGGEENKQFWAATPSGKIEMSLSVPETAEKFVPGADILVDFHIPDGADEGTQLAKGN